MTRRRARPSGLRVAQVGMAAVLAGTLLPVGSATAVEARPEWGSLSAKDRVLKRSCRDYPYAYAVTVPEKGLWDLNVRLVGPGGRALWFGYLMEGANPERGTATFRLCRSKARPGRYKLKAVVSVQDNNDYSAGRLATVTFRLRKAR